MSNTAKNGSRLPIRGSTLLVLVFMAVTIVPAFIAFALTPQDAQVVTNVQGWNGCAYMVRPGDNLFRIGVRYGVTYEYLAQINGIYNPNYVYAGQTISVPCGGVPYPPAYPNYHPSHQTYYPPYQCPWCQPFEKPADCGPTIQYTVQPGDNLFRIAVTYGSTIQWIRTENGLWGKVLRPGMVLNVPCQGYVKTYPPLTPGTSVGPTGGIVTQTFTPQQPSEKVIHIQNQQFQRPNRKVKVNDTVVWINDDPAGTYTIQIGPPINQQLIPIGPGQTTSYNFQEAGSYTYTMISPPVQPPPSGAITVDQ